MAKSARLELGDTILRTFWNGNMFLLSCIIVSFISLYFDCITVRFVLLHYSTYTGHRLLSYI